MTATPPEILVVEDDTSSRTVLVKLMIGLGYHPIGAATGPDALALLSEFVPDLILLDLMLPGMDGRDLLARLRQLEALRDTPVIVVSGIEDTENVVRCISLGADDYLCKPFEPAILRARVENSLRRKRLQEERDAAARKLEEYTHGLERRVAEQCAGISGAYRTLRGQDKLKADLLRQVAYEVRTALAADSFASEPVFGGIPGAVARPDKQAALGAAGRRMAALIDQALDLDEAQASGDDYASFLSRVSIAGLARDLCSNAARSSVEPAFTFVPPGPGHYDVYGDRTLLTAALKALMETASQLAAPGAAVTVTCASSADGAEVVIRTQGRSIPESHLAGVFDAFAVREAAHGEMELCLGAPLAARIVRTLGGEVRAENAASAGAAFIVTLPRCK